MQFSAVEIRFIVTIYLYSTFANDLKRKYFFFRKMFIVTEYAALSSVGTYLPGTVLQRCRLFKQFPNLPAGNCVTVVQAV